MAPREQLPTHINDVVIVPQKTWIDKAGFFVYYYRRKEVITMRLALPKPVETALSRLEKAGYSAYVVGGCVRDHVLGFTPHDYDICSAATPEEMQKVFQGERTIETGLKHGTLTVLLSGMPLEITTYRVDGAYSDGRHPDSVQFTARVEDDLSRRDFTINAMAYSPSAGLVDPFGGQADCERGVIRCVGDPAARFGEDALRILRALRFSSRLGFPIEEATAQAAVAGMKNSLLPAPASWKTKATVYTSTEAAM